MLKSYDNIIMGIFTETVYEQIILSFNFVNLMMISCQ